eukprot:UN31671
MDAMQLKHIFTTNPFAVMGLMNTEKEHFIWDGSDDSISPILRPIIRVLSKKYPRARLVFDKNFDVLFLEIIDSAKKTITQIKPGHKNFDKEITKLITLLVFVYQFIHSILHIADFLLISALSEVTLSTQSSPKESNCLEELGCVFQDNMYLKYLETKSFYFRRSNGKKGLLTGGAFITAEDADIYAAGAQFLKNMLGHVTSEDMVKNMLGQSKQVLQHELVLQEMRKHLNLIPEYATNLTERCTADELKIINDKLKSIFSRTGANSFIKIQNLQQWLEIQATLGIVHTGSLSLSRLMLTKYCIPDGNFVYKPMNVPFKRKSLDTTPKRTGATPKDKTVYNDMGSNINDRIATVLNDDKFEEPISTYQSNNHNNSIKNNINNNGFSSRPTHSSRASVELANNNKYQNTKTSKIKIKMKK